MTTIDPDIWTGNPADTDIETGTGTGVGAGSTTADDTDPLTDSGTAVSQAALNPVARLFRTLRERAVGVAADDHGMSTVEYALGTVAAAAFGALLYTVVTGGQITDALTDIIERALNTQ
ncbi:DUF4244 domain-containing protein [Corynebacterium xerosis]|uniref:DUF4244 domain-containing protein n=1 Tax=Corynebacterium xerosis TaxID=1725 RepID=A0A6B8TIH2_9CORY|nr:DUF4244 domain-containing protein [Corynebacterium xerosis]